MKKVKHISCIALLTILLAQCYPAKMGLNNDEWVTKEEYKVEGKRGLFKKERMQFGDYRTTQVKRSWIKGSNSRFGLGSGNPASYDYTNIISLEYINRRQTVNFSLTDNSNHHSEVFCASHFNASEVVVGNRPNSIFNIGVDVVKNLLDAPDSKYYVQIYTAEERPWELILDNVSVQRKPKEYVGYLTKGRDQFYTIHPVYQMQDKSGKPANILFGSVGYQIRNKKGQPLAAVSLIDKGVVYFQSANAEERFLLANVCAALLMQDQIE